MICYKLIRNTIQLIVLQVVSVKKIWVLRVKHIQMPIAVMVHTMEKSVIVLILLLNIGIILNAVIYFYFWRVFIFKNLNQSADCLTESIVLLLSIHVCAVKI